MELTAVSVTFMVGQRSSALQRDPTREITPEMIRAVLESEFSDENEFVEVGEVTVEDVGQVISLIDGVHLELSEPVAESVHASVTDRNLRELQADLDRLCGAARAYGAIQATPQGDGDQGDPGDEDDFEGDDWDAPGVYELTEMTKANVCCGDTTPQPCVNCPNSVINTDDDCPF